MAFKLLVYHNMPQKFLDEYARNNVQVVRGKNPTEQGICADIEDCDGLIAFEQPEHGFNKKIIDAAPKLKIIARRGVGYETVDVEYATERGIYVTNTPAINSRSVAEATVMLMLECVRNAQKVNESFRKMRSRYKMFASDEDTRGFELTGRTLGLIGCGNIGRNVAQIASSGFGMQVIGYDPYITELPPYIHQGVSVDEVLSVSDFVSLHLPSTAQTKEMFNLEKLKKMKKSAILINTSRGDIVCEKDLIIALREKIIRGAGLDVFSHEPIEESSYPLFEFERVCLTPHNASYTVESLYNALHSVQESVLDVVRGNAPHHRVNQPSNPRKVRKEGKKCV